MKLLREQLTWLGLCTLALAALSACDPLIADTPDASAGKTCGGLLGRGCERGSFCRFTPEAQCGAADQTGTCEPVPQVCNAIYAPVCGCDGKTYGNECEANGKSVSAASKGECDASTPPDEDARAPSPDDASVADSCTAPPAEDAGAPSEQSCGGIAGLRCGDGQFCDYGAICSSIADGTGVCRSTPTGCTKEYAPVCGCDGNTYGNACTAHSKGVSIASKGECKPASEGHTCGGIAALTCDRGQFCNYEPPRGQGCDGTVADAAGVCQVIPQVCTALYDPVCGCDGKTYSSSCTAHVAGMSVAAKGECKAGR